MAGRRFTAGILLTLLLGCAETGPRMQAKPPAPAPGERPNLLAAKVMSPGLARIAMRDTLQRRHLYNVGTIMPDLLEPGRLGTSLYEARNIRVTADSLSFDYDEDAMTWKVGGLNAVAEPERRSNHVDFSFRGQSYCAGIVAASDRRGGYFEPVGIDAPQGLFAWQDRRDGERFCDAWSALVYYARLGSVDDMLVFAANARGWRERPESRPAPPSGWDRERILAEQSFRERDLVRALEHFEAGIIMYPAWSEGWFNAALVYEVLGDYDAAANRMRHYLAMNPDANDARAAREKVIYWEDKARRQ